MTNQEIQDSIGKRICVKHNGINLCGILSFAGENTNFPSWGYQLTVDGMPVTNVDINTVSLFVPREKIIKQVSEDKILELAKEAFSKYGSTLEKLGNS